MVSRTTRLGRTVIPSDNTPLKGVNDILMPSPKWRYKGPAKEITITYQVGRWGAGFAGDTKIVTDKINQVQSDDWKDFELQPDQKLTGVKLETLGNASNDTYDMEMWFKATGMADQGAIFTGCCKVPSASPQLDIVSCSFS